jgi:hypothetical protein
VSPEPEPWEQATDAVEPDAGDLRRSGRRGVTLRGTG